ncbi:hypothetical protein SADUNF_Sadunf02G0145700 [Salix dunnii]|uniref:Aluminum activated malate transporter family protein n=1 Tax=Salix dunnii TaxID=1413687 RepID=A0A835N8A3_9ROSI|nr:hypothetical protein SADUNF_Sadunf02G0145700 [Salix dunnii]
MVMGNRAPNELEWRVNVPNGTSEILQPESGLIHRIWLCLKGLLGEFMSKIWNFLEKARNIAVAEPKKVIHCLKVGVALTIVSLFYYMRPLYEGVGGNAMWAIMTVVVVFENTVGATLYKSINRAVGTFLAGSLGVGIHWVASHSGDKLEPIILGISVFLLGELELVPKTDSWTLPFVFCFVPYMTSFYSYTLVSITASATTFSRFIPSVKARFDYGALIFILTFSLVSVSGYRVDKLIDVAHQSLSTVAIGTTLCVLISMLFYPIWAGKELNNLIHRNLEKLADALDGCIAIYFTESGAEDSWKKIGGYKCVLNSKAAEDSMAGFARWEPAHGRFSFRHPWNQYLKVGASLRSCAYCIETLDGCINSEIQAPELLRRHLSDACITLSSSASFVLKELAITVKTMRKSSEIDFSIGEMQYAVLELENTLKSLPNWLVAIQSSTSNVDAKAEPIRKIATPSSVMDILPLATLVSMLTETAARIKEIADEVCELAKLADFKPSKIKKANQSQSSNQVDEP